MQMISVICFLQIVGFIALLLLFVSKEEKLCWFYSIFNEMNNNFNATHE